MANIGRPLLFETPQDLQNAVDEYFENTQFDEYTVTGLALALGTSRETLDNYQSRQEYRDIIKRAKLMVEHSYEMSLRKKGKTTDIFALKNFGWKDQQEYTHLTEDDEGKRSGIKFV
jgi:hypothetical protein